MLAYFVILHLYVSNCRLGDDWTYTVEECNPQKCTTTQSL